MSRWAWRISPLHAGCCKWKRSLSNDAAESLSGDSKVDKWEGLTVKVFIQEQNIQNKQITMCQTSLTKIGSELKEGSLNEFHRNVFAYVCLFSFWGGHHFFQIDEHILTWNRMLFYGRKTSGLQAGWTCRWPSWYAFPGDLLPIGSMRMVCLPTIKINHSWR